MGVTYPQITGQISGNTAGATALISSGTWLLAGGNNITLSQDGNSISFVGGAGGGGSLNISAGTTSNNLTAVTFANANGISFGLDASTVTASHNALTSQSNQALSGSNGSFTFQTATFGNLNNFSFYTSNGSIVGSYTVPSTAGLISAINVSGGTTSNNLSAITFANANGVSFGLDGSTVTGSHNALTSQSNQNVTAGNGGFAFQTLSFSNANGISFGTSAGSAITGSHNALTSQSNQAFSADASSTFQTLSFQDSNGVSFSNNAGALRVTHALQFTSATSAITSNALNTSASRVINIIANTNNTGGGTASLSSNVSFSAANGLTFYTSAGNAIVASYTVPTQTNQTLGIYVTAQSTGQSSSSTYDARSLSIVGDGIISAGWSNSTLRISATQSNQAFTAAGGSSAFQTLAFGDTNSVSFTNTNGSVGIASIKLQMFAVSNTTQSTSGTANHTALSFGGAGLASVGVTGGSVIISVPAGAPSPVNFSAGTTSGDLGSVVFSNSNGVSFGLNGSTITASVAAGGADGGVFAGVSTGGNTAGSTGTVSTGNFVLVGTNGITLSQSTGAAGSAATVTIIGPQKTFSGSYLGPNAGIGPVPFAQSSISLGQNSLYIYPVVLDNFLTIDHIRMPVMVTNSSSAAASVQKGYTYQFAIYTRNATNATVLTRHYSTSYTMAVSHNSNASWMLSMITAINNSTSYNTLSASSAGLNLSASLHGAREFIMPVSSLLTPGEYWMALRASTSSVGAAGSVLMLSNLAVAHQTFNRPGGSTNATSSGWYQFMGQGTYSATTASPPAGISMTQINQLGTMPILFAATGTV